MQCQYAEVAEVAKMLPSSSRICHLLEMIGCLEIDQPDMDLCPQFYPIDAAPTGPGLIILNNDPGITMFTYFYG